MPVKAIRDLDGNDIAVAEFPFTVTADTLGIGNIPMPFVLLALVLGGGIGYVFPRPKKSI